MGSASRLRSTPGDSGLAAGLGPGGTAHWLYPESASRTLVAYAVVALWLMCSLGHRELRTFDSLLWWAPLAYAAANVALLAPLVLVQGRAAEFLSEQGGRAGLRLVIHLLRGCDSSERSRWKPCAGCS